MIITKTKLEYGDFQTPQSLADQATLMLRQIGIEPSSVLEPTCGKGSFLLSAAKVFPEAKKFIGVDINQTYLNYLRTQVVEAKIKARTRLIMGDFFYLDWDDILSLLPEPILIIGNPPWVTSAELGLLKSKNLPEKSNFQGRRGYEAITGKSNFDISEWMFLKHLDWLSKRRGVIAMLCKTAVARKVLFHAWKHVLPVSFARLYRIDAQKYFGASVDACFLIVDLEKGASLTDCSVFESFESSVPSHSIGFHDGMVLSNVALYKKRAHLGGGDQAYKWRSGIKHDCSKVMELEKVNGEYMNGFGKIVVLEDKYVYPMIKSSDIGNGALRLGRKYMIVTQQYIGEETLRIRMTAPKTWQYLHDNKEVLAKRASSIYRNRPMFSIFGVGKYSFSPWKVAVSGFYKHLTFRVIEPYKNRPVVCDDTVYFLSCWSEDEAVFLAALLNSRPAQEFYKSMIFWTDKRPITIEVLSRLDLKALSSDLGQERKYLFFARRRRDSESEYTVGQLSLGIAEKKAKYGKAKSAKRFGGRAHNALHLA